MASSDSKRNIWLIPTLVVLVAIGASLGYRAWQAHRQESTELYQRELNSFGVIDMGAPITSPSHFARHGSIVVEDMNALLESRDANALARRQAMEVLVLVQGGDAAPALIAQVEQQDSKVRERAIELLGRTESDQAADYLISLTERPQLAEPALAALSTMPEKARAHEAHIIGLLDNEDDGVARQAALTLGSIGSSEGRQTLLARLESAALAQPAARGLARMQDERGITYLLEVLKGDREGGRDAAEAGLAEAGAAAEPHVSSLLSSEDDETVASALRVLKHIGKTENHPQWIPFIRSENEEVRLAVLELLDARPAAPAAREVFRFLAAERAQLSQNEINLAERVLRQASREDFDFYAEQLDGADPAAQTLAIRTIAFSQNPGAADLLVEGLSHESATVRRESALSLGRLHGVGGLGDRREDVFDRIKELSENDPDEKVRQTARSLLVVLR